MTTYASESQKLTQDTVVELLDITHPAVSYRFTRTPAAVGDIMLGGVTYFGRDFQLSRFEVTTGDPLPRPLLAIDNIDDGTNRGYFTSTIAQNDDLRGAVVRFREIYSENLDGGANPDSSQAFTDLTFIIRQNRVLHRTRVEWLCATPPDQEQILFGRVMRRNECQREYRVPDPDNPDTFFQNSCPWGDQTLRPGSGTVYFNKANVEVSDYRQDSCSGTLAGCRARFGNNAALPCQLAANIGKRS